MKSIKKILTALALVVSSFAWLPAVTVKAVAVDLVCTWDGGGADSNFSTVANWDDEIDCTSTNMIDDATNNLKWVFPTGVAGDRILNNDLTAATKVHSISFTGSDVDANGYTINGNSITLLGDITDTRTVYSPNFLNFSDINIGSNVEISSVYSFFIDSILSGNGNITINSPSVSINFTGNNATWSGDLTIASGYLYASFPNSLGTSTGKTTVNKGAELTIYTNAAVTINEPFEFTGAADAAEDTRLFIFSSGGATDQAEADPVVTLAGSIVLANDINITGFGRDAKITGALSGGSKKINVNEGTDFQLEVASSANTSGTPNGIYKSALRTVTINAELSDVGAFIGYNNKFIIESPGKYGDIVLYGGYLYGTGTVKIIDMNSGKVAPGLSPGCLSSGNLDYTGGTVEIEIGGTTKCSGYDQQIVVGTVSLGSAATELSVINLDGYKAKVNDSFTIIDNDAADAVTGTFKDKAEGATFTVSGITFKITYKGGDGNDVVLTVMQVPAAPNTGIYTGAYTSLIVLGGSFLAVSVYLLGAKKLKVSRRRK